MRQSIDESGKSGIKVRLAISDAGKEKMMRDLLSADEGFSLAHEQGLPTPFELSSDDEVILIIDHKGMTAAFESGPSLLRRIARSGHTLVALLENRCIGDVLGLDLARGWIILDQGPDQIVEAVRLSRFGYSAVPPSIGSALQAALSSRKDELRRGACDQA